MSGTANFLDGEWPERLRRGVMNALRHCGVSKHDWVRRGYDVHHIVAAGLDGAAPGRAVLARWCVGVHSVANAVVIPRSFHQRQGLHRLGFLQMVNQRLFSAEMFADALSARTGREAGRLIMVQTIQKIGNELVLRSEDSVAIRLQDSLQSMASRGSTTQEAGVAHSCGGVSATERSARKQKFASVEGADRANAPLFGKQRFSIQLAAGCS